MSDKIGPAMDMQSPPIAPDEIATLASELIHDYGGDAHHWIVELVDRLVGAGELEAAKGWEAVLVVVDAKLKRTGDDIEGDF